MIEKKPINSQTTSILPPSIRYIVEKLSGHKITKTFPNGKNH